MKLVAEFGGDDPIFTIPLNRLPYQRFRQVIPVAFGRIDEVNAEFLRSLEQCIDLPLR